MKVAAGLAAALLASCASVPRTYLAVGTASEECVVLLHGLNRSYRAMEKMSEALHGAGYTTANIDYPSQSGPVEELAAMAVDRGLGTCRDEGAGRIHFVTHSVGGILLRYAHSNSPIEDLGRVVMLGPPNQGSELVDATRDWPGTSLFSGEAGLQLGTDESSIPSRLGPVDFELGVIAGTGTISFFSLLLPNPDDGKVSLQRTRVAGMTDFLVVDNSHHYITTSDEVIDNTLHFLKTGHFLSSDDTDGQPPSGH